MNNRYAIESPAEEGIHRATDRNLGDRPVLIREIRGDASPGAVARVRADAHRLASVLHPHLVTLVDFFEVDGNAYLVVGNLEGDTLSSRADRAPLPELVMWVDQLADALEHLHARQPPVLFTETSPFSAVVDGRGQARLVPFGLARALDADEDASTCVAPEMFGGRSIDARVDVYALGATLYHLVTGQRPPLAVDLLSGEARLPSVGQGPELDALVAKAMAPRREDRHASARALRADLRRLTAGGPLGGLRLPPLPETASPAIAAPLPETASPATAASLPGTAAATPVTRPPAANEAPPTVDGRPAILVAPSPAPRRQPPTPGLFRRLPRGPLDEPRAAGSPLLLAVVFPTLLVMGLGGAWWMGRDARPALSAAATSSASPAASAAPPVAVAPSTAAPTPDRPARTTSVFVFSEPSGARVSIDGQVATDANGMVVTPAKIDVTPGRHQVLIEKNGYETFRTTIPNIREGQVRRIQASLHVPPAAQAPPPPHAPAAPSPVATRLVPASPTRTYGHTSVEVPGRTEPPTPAYAPPPMPTPYPATEPTPPLPPSQRRDPLDAHITPADTRISPREP